MLEREEEEEEGRARRWDSEVGLKLDSGCCQHVNVTTVSPHQETFFGGGGGLYIPQNSYVAHLVYLSRLQPTSSAARLGEK